MRWITAGEPLPSWREWSTMDTPTTGNVRPDELVWRSTPAGRLAISSRTGGWAVFEPDEAGLLTGPARIEDAGPARAVVEAAWRRGLITVDGRSPYSAPVHQAAVEATRDYYTLVLLLNQGCNLVCRYCYLGHAAPTPSRAMPTDLARTAVLGALDQPWGTVLIDCGEIAVAWPAFRDLVPWAERAADERGKTVRVSIQTNGTTLDDEVADFLAEHDVAVGISLDGPQPVHDAARQFRSGAGSYDRAVAAIARCVDRGLSVHLIATITRRNIDQPDAVMAELAAHHPRSTLLKPVLAEGEAGAAWAVEAIDESDFATFMGAAVSYADATNVDTLDQSAGKFLLRLLGDRSGWRDSCTSRSCGSGRSLHVVGSTGSVHACPRFVADPPTSIGAGRQPLLALGPTRTALAAGPLPDLLPAGLRTAPESCAGCPWLGSCGGGCTLISQRGHAEPVPLPDPHCVAYVAIHEALFATAIPSFLAGRHATSPTFNGARVELVRV